MNTQTTKRLVLGEGEVAGHKHVLVTKETMEFDKADNRIRFLLTNTGILTHDEHDRMVFMTGKYRSYHQVESNPMDGSTGWVFD